MNHDESYSSIATPPPKVIKTRNRRTKTTLLDRLGGVTALDAVVDGLYFRVMADDDLAAFFAGIDLHSLKAHQRQFMATAFSNKGPSHAITRKRLFKAHRRLFSMGLNATHFDKVVGHLEAALSDLLIDRCVVLEVVDILRPFREMFERNAKVKTEKRLRIKKWAARQKAKLLGFVTSNDSPRLTSS